MVQRKRTTVVLDDETLALLDRAYKRIANVDSVALIPMSERVARVLKALLDQWDTTEEIFSGEAANDPVSLPTSVEEAMQSITQPDIGLEVKVRHDKTTPRSLDGLVPWEYVAAGYSTLPFIAKAAKDYTNTGEKRVLTIRTILTRIPEDQWESEQTRSIVEKALAGLT